MNSKSLFLIGSIGLLFNGCVRVGPDFCTPHAPVTEEWIESPDERVTHDETLTDWWKVFHDPVLDNLILTAYQQNLPLRIAGLRILEARAQLGILVGEQFPQLQEAVAEATHTKISKHAPNTGLNPDNPYRDYIVGLQAAWELDFWGKFRRGIESADSSFLATVENYDDVLVILLGDVATTYVQVRLIQEQIEIVNRNIKVQHRSWEIADAQFRGGFVTELDVQQALSFLKDTEARIPSLEILLRQAENSLSILLGIPPTDLTECLGKGKIPSTSDDVAVGIPGQLLCRRPDIRRALLEAQAQSARIGIAYSDFFPQISLTGFIGKESSGNSSVNINKSSGNLLDSDSLTYNYGANIVWPFLNYGRITNRVRVEDALLQQLLVNYEETVLQAYREVEDGLVTFLKSQDRMKLLAESVKAAQRSAQLSNTQYVEGAVDYTRVLNSQQFLLEEEARHTLSNANIAFGLIATYKALGGGWEIRCGNEFIPCETKCEMLNRTYWGDMIHTDDISSHCFDNPLILNQPIIR